MAILVCFSLISCATVYDDTNGADNFTLQTITDDNIINRNIGSSGFGYSESEAFGITSSEYSSKNFNGVEEIFITTYITKSTFSVYIGHLTVRSGNFRLVAVNNDEIIYDFPLDSFGDTIWFEDIKGSFAIRAAGESASFSMYLSVD